MKTPSRSATSFGRPAYQRRERLFYVIAVERRLHLSNLALTEPVRPNFVRSHR